MSDHQRQVLDMLAAGKISADEAAKLLERLNKPAEPTGFGGVDERYEASAGPAGEPGKPLPKYLRVTVNDAGSAQVKVNVRIPLSLVRAGVRLGALLPNDAREALRAKGIDAAKLSQLEPDELIAALNELTVDVNGPQGETVRIFCE